MSLFLRQNLSSILLFLIRRMWRYSPRWILPKPWSLIWRQRTAALNACVLACRPCKFPEERFWHE